MTGYGNYYYIASFSTISMVIHFISYRLIVHYIPHCLWTT